MKESIKNFVKLVFILSQILPSCKKESMPIVSTIEIAEITVNSAKSGGIIANEGTSTVVSRGVCWSTKESPTINDSKTVDGAGAGNFTSFVTGLSGSTKYYIRAYATNNDGTGYGQVLSFSTQTPITDKDGNIYETVKIGNQTWMLENLKTTKFNDGNPITLISDNTTWANTTAPAFCWYGNEISNKNIYGALYNGYAVLTSKLCPVGWHIPTDVEWKTLEVYLGMTEMESNNVGYRGTNQGGKLKESGVINWNQPNTDATNESGFTALPGGWRSTGPFSGLKTLGLFWSSTQYSTSLTYRLLSNQYGKINRSTYGDREYGYSVRCIKD